MAKKKKRKVQNQKAEPKNSYTVELLGVLLVFAVVVGIWRKGAVGEVIYKFGSYVAGSWAVVFLVLVAFIGFYMIVRRHKPHLLGMRIFGLYIAFVGLLMFAHSNYVMVSENMGETIKLTIDNFVSTIDGATTATGGGVVGAFFASIFVKLVAKEGTYAIAALLIIYGFIKVSGHSIIDVFRVLIARMRKMNTKKIIVLSFLLLMK